MDLTDTFDGCNTPDRSEASRESCERNADTAASRQRPKPQHASLSNDDNINDPAYQLGRDIAIAMACGVGAERLKNIKDAKSDKSEKAGPSNGEHDNASRSDSTRIPPPPLTVSELSAKMCSINADIDSQRAELIGLLVFFDDKKGWESSGAKSCADWGNRYLGIAKKNMYEHLRVGRELLQLPRIRGLFRGGELSWSKTKLLTRVADADNECYLASVALEVTVSDVERICREFRWPKSEAETIDPDTGRSVADLRAEQQFNNRALTWNDQSDGSVQIRLTLPPEKAQAVLKSIEHCENELFGSMNADSNTDNDTDTDSDSDSDSGTNSKPTATQRRADAIVLMAERSLQHAGTSVSRADRYQVVMHIDHSDFTSAAPSPNSSTSSGSTSSGSTPSVETPPTSNHPFPTKVPWVEGIGPIADSVAHRIACDASIVSFVTQDGEPLDVGRQTRTWPTNISRAIRARDRHCQFPGCTESRHLDIHHIVHWANYGHTSVENGICLCSRHHTLVHEGGWVIERNIIETNTHPDSKDFGVTEGFVSPAKKTLLPTRCRFRFIKPAGKVNSSSAYSRASGATSAGGSAEPSSCCDNHCHEPEVHYQVPIQNDKTSSETVTTWRLNEVSAANLQAIKFRASKHVNKESRKSRKSTGTVTTWRQTQPIRIHH